MHYLADSVFPVLLLPNVSPYATEEVQVLKGGFSAEYGDVTSGVINSAVQTGRDDHYAGWIRWRTDVPALWGSQSTGTRIERDGTRFKAVDAGEGAKLQGANENTFEFGTGGPLPFLSKGNTFYIKQGNIFTKLTVIILMKLMTPGVIIGDRCPITAHGFAI